MNYDLTDSENGQYQEILADMSLRGGRLTDSRGRPIAFRVLTGRRFIVCDRGLLWRYAAAGSPKVPGQAGGAVRRNSAVEMWTGRWRTVRQADGSAGYAKCLVWVPLDDNINGHAGITKLGWYRSEKGFRHPHEDPQEPGAEEIAALAARNAASADAVSARIQEEGLHLPPSSADVSAPTTPPTPPGCARGGPAQNRAPAQDKPQDRSQRRAS